MDDPHGQSQASPHSDEPKKPPLLLMFDPAQAFPTEPNRNGVSYSPECRAKLVAQLKELSEKYWAVPQPAIPLRNEEDEILFGGKAVIRPYQIQMLKAALDCDAQANGRMVIVVNKRRRRYGTQPWVRFSPPTKEDTDA